jgi:hypothetical protein
VLDDDNDDESTPENGWIFEKDEAIKAIKCERNGHNIFRLARAYHKLIKTMGKNSKILRPPQFSMKQSQ